jgi:hypothetical protein
MDKFNHDSHYVIYCDTGGRSSSAAFLLTQDGFHVSYLEGGLESNPEAGIKQVGSTEAASVPTPAPVPEKDVEEVVDKLDQTIDNVDSVVKAAVLEADLAKKQMDLDAAEKKQKKESEQGDKKKQEALEAEKKKLEQEKIEIERQKKLAEEEVNKNRQEEEEKIEQSKKNAESRMQEEKETLEEIYSKNTEEMEKLQEMKARAEEQIKKAKEQLEKQASESRRELDEARSLKDSVKAEKKKIEEEAIQQREKQLFPSAPVLTLHYFVQFYLQACAVPHLIVP